MVDLMLALAVTAVSAWLIGGAGRWSGRVSNGLVGLAGGWRPELWPRGVQEEDRGRPWGRPPASARQEQVTKLVSVPLTRVKGIVSGR